jgi:hypothetical protein
VKGWGWREGLERGIGERDWREGLERGIGERDWREGLERGIGERWMYVRYGWCKVSGHVSALEE